jgi:hypothetical protein
MGCSCRTLALYETTCLGALHEQSDEGVVSPLNHSGAQGPAIRARPAGLLSVSGRIRTEQGSGYGDRRHHIWDHHDRRKDL